MGLVVRRMITHPALALGSTVLWGVVELLALTRSRLLGRMRLGTRRRP